MGTFNRMFVASICSDRSGTRGGSSWIAYAESHDALAIGLMHDCVSVGTNGGLVKRDTPRQQSERTTATSVQKNVAHQAGT